MSEATKPVVKDVTTMASPVSLKFRARAGKDLSRFLRGMKERRIVGRVCPSCNYVYVPPRGACPTCGCPMGEERHDRDDGQPRQGWHQLQRLPRLLALHAVGQKAKGGLIWHIDNR